MPISAHSRFDAGVLACCATNRRFWRRMRHVVGFCAAYEKQNVGDYACIAFIKGPMPMMFITRVRL